MAGIRQTNTPGMRLTIRTDVIDREFFSPTGSVGRMTKNAAYAVHRAAVANITAKYGSKSRHNNSGGPSLRKSGKVEPSRIGGPNYDVVFTHEAAEVHHTGAKPHYIDTTAIIMTPKGPRPKMWRSKGGGGVNTPYDQPIASVVHPGHAPNRYLTDAGRDVGLKVSQQPGSRGLGSRPGIARIPRGFV